jgi:hypothetical protein
MSRRSRIALTVSAALLLPAAAAQAQTVTEKAARFNPHGVTFKSGAYRCELGQRVQVREVSADMQTAVLHWKQRDYRMRAVGARSGALRYEDPSSGLVWLMIPSTSMLLDARQGQRLASDCRI